MPNAGEDVKQELSDIAGENAKWFSPFGRQSGFSYKLNILLPFYLVITPLGTSPQKLKTGLPWWRSG